MTPEERLELHEQWLLSMESNHSQMSADLAELKDGLIELKDVVVDLARRQDQVSQVMLTLGQNQSVLFMAMASLTGNLDRLTGEVRELRDAVDRYIRFRGDGQPQN